MLLTIFLPTVLAAEHGPSWNPLHFDPGTTALTVIVFAVVLVLLRKFAWGPLLAAVDAREKRIADALGAADKAREEAAELRKTLETEIARTRADAQRALEESRQAAQGIAREIEARARDAAEALKRRADQEIELARRQALDEVRREAVDLALRAASAVVGRSMTGDDHQRIAEEVLAGVGETA